MGRRGNEGAGEQPISITKKRGREQEREGTSKKERREDNKDKCITGFTFPDGNSNACKGSKKIVKALGKFRI